jgi:hypothetical protein
VPVGQLALPFEQWLEIPVDEETLAVESPTLTRKKEKPEPYVAELAVKLTRLPLISKVTRFGNVLLLSVPMVTLVGEESLAPNVVSPA